MAVQASGIFFLRESKADFIRGNETLICGTGTGYAPVLLERKAKRLQKESRRADLEKGTSVIYKTIYSASEERQ